MHYLLDTYKKNFARTRDGVAAARVFVLGAGFSRDFGYTTSDTIVQGVLSFYENDLRINVRRLNRVYDFPWHSWHLHRLQDFLHVSGASRDSLDLYSFLRLTSNIAGLEARNHFFCLLTDYMFSYLLMNQVVNERYVGFIKTLSPRDAIVTFNWDVIPESLMRTQAIPFTRHEWLSDRIMIIKLHGSLDLLSGPSETMHRDLHALPERFELLTSDLWRAVTAEEYWPWPTFALLKKLWPWMKYDRSGLFIVPPYETAGYDREYIRYNWERAQQLLRDCERIIVIGYSFPEEDGEFARVLQTVYQERSKPIELWNPDPGARRRLQELLKTTEIGGGERIFSETPFIARGAGT